MQPQTEPDPASNPTLQVLLLLVLVLINAFFAMSEIAVISLSDAKIDRLAAEGNRRARRIQKLTASSSRFLSMIQIGVTLAGFLASASAAQSFVAALGGALARVTASVPALQRLMPGVATVAITLLISYFSLVLGEIVPKRVAMKYPERISLAIAGVLGFFSFFLRPFVWVVSASANAVLRLVGIDPNADDEAVTEEEIRMLVDVGGEKGVLEDTQKEMINNIFEFDDINAGDIMTHRTEIVGVEVNEPLEAVIEASIREGVSRVPVYEEDLDSIIGIIYIKDLLQYIGTVLPGGSSLRGLMREPRFVPETKPCGDLFKEMTANHIQIAIVVDEYGGTAGLVTLEDVLESIVGNIQDEYDNEREEFSRINDTTFRLDGAADIETVEDQCGVALPEGEYDTVAGFVISRLGYLPQEGETPEIVCEGLRFSVERVEDRRIATICVEILPKPQQDTDGE
ncbi:MAG: hemolysin family protein [Oscillospiraceae bacterium]|jgi:putative hemolysin|nr:hemolysin family protein [Oscillospiraceae bacterium]